MRKIGIIGGMSYESSLHYYERINDGVNKKLGDLTCAEMVIYNVNFQPIRKKMLRGDWEGIKDILVVIAKKLEGMGVDAIAIATNTIHKVADDVAKEISIPLIHIADCVSEKCIQDGKKKVGLLGTKYTMEEDFLKDKLTKRARRAYFFESEELSELCSSRLQCCTCIGAAHQVKEQSIKVPPCLTDKAKSLTADIF